MKLGGLLSYIKGCSDGWFRHAPLKLKSDENNSSCLVEESEYACVPYLCFLEGLYSADENVIVVLTMHFDFLL